MKKVQLFTAAKEFVTEVLVAPFQKPPDVLIWGSRVFINDPAGQSFEPVYREAFAVVVWTAEEMRSMQIMSQDDANKMGTLQVK